MKFFKNLLIIGIIFLYAIPSWSQESGLKKGNKDTIHLSLNEVLQLALLNNFDVQLAFYDRLIKETDIDKSKSIYDTVLTLTGEYDYNRKEQPTTILGTSSHTGTVGAKLEKRLITGTELTLDFQSERKSTDSPFSTLNPSYESILEMRFVQPILRNFFGMQDLGEVKITKIDVNNFNLEVLDRIEKNLADVEKAYWDLVVASKLVEIREKMYKRAEEFYDINKKKKELGTSELTDLLAAEANMELRRSELDIEEDNLKTAINKLKLLINHPNNEKDILPLDTLGVRDKEVLLNNNLKLAFENRRDYKRAKEDIKAKKIKFNMKRNARWPQLDLEGSLKLNGVERMWKDAAADAFTHENPEYNAKATFSFPFEDRESRSEYNKAKNEKLKALLSFKKIEKLILTEIDDSVRKINVYRDKTEKAMRIEELQRKKLEEEERQFRYGRSDSDRIIRFQEDLLNAKIETLRSLKEYKDSAIDLYLTQNTFLVKRDLTVQ